MSTYFGFRYYGKHGHGGAESASWLGNELTRGIISGTRTGFVRVQNDDGWTFFYRIRRGELKEFKRWVIGYLTYGCSDHQYIIKGSYPSYQLVERRG